MFCGPRDVAELFGEFPKASSLASRRSDWVFARTAGKWTRVCSSWAVSRAVGTVAFQANRGHHEDH